MGLIRSWRERTFHDQFLDLTGLIFQGLLVPGIATILAGWVLPEIMTVNSKISNVPGIILFLLPFTLVDYLYYWNHRALHSAKLWFLHRVHHSPKYLDIWMTSRNSLWTPMCLVYVWLHALLIHWIQDPLPYVLGMWGHGLLDLLRHSGVATPNALRFLGTFFILPEDHEWHHSQDRSGVNFGANLNFWDRWHGTFYRPNTRPEKLGTEERGRFHEELLFPWRIKS